MLTAASVCAMRWVKSIPVAWLQSCWDMPIEGNDLPQVTATCQSTPSPTRRANVTRLPMFELVAFEHLHHLQKGHVLHVLRAAFGSFKHLVFLGWANLHQSNAAAHLRCESQGPLVLPYAGGHQTAQFQCLSRDQIAPLELVELFTSNTSKCQFWLVVRDMFYFPSLFCCDDYVIII